MAQVADFLIKISADTADANKITAALKKAGIGIQDIESVQKKTERSSQSLADAINKLGSRAALTIPIWLALRGAMTGVLATISQGLQHFVEFEQALLRIRTVMRDTSADLNRDMKTLADTVTQLARQTGVSTGGLAKSFLEFAQTGLTFEQSLAGMNAATKLSIALQGDGIATAQSLALAYRLLGDTIDQTLPVQQQFESIAGKILILDEKNAFTLDQLNEGIKAFAGTAKVMNLSLDETVSLLSALNSAGVQGSKAGQLLKTSFFQFVDSLDEVKKKLQITIDASQSPFEGLLETLRRIRELQEEGRGAQAALAIPDIFGGAKGAQVVSALVGLLGLLEDNLDQVANSSDAVTRAQELLNKAVEEANNSIGRQIQRSKELRAQIGESFLRGLFKIDDTVEGLKEFNRVLEQDVIPQLRIAGEIIAFMGKTLFTLGQTTFVGQSLTFGIQGAFEAEKALTRAATEDAKQIELAFRGAFDAKQLDGLIQKLEEIDQRTAGFGKFGGFDVNQLLPRLRDLRAGVLEPITSREQAIIQAALRELEVEAADVREVLGELRDISIVPTVTTLTEDRVTELLSLSTAALKAKTDLQKLQTAQPFPGLAEQLAEAETRVSTTEQALRDFQGLLGTVGKDGLPHLTLGVQQLAFLQAQLESAGFSAQATNAILARFRFDPHALGADQLEAGIRLLQEYGATAEKARQIILSLQAEAPVSPSTLTLTAQQIEQLSSLAVGFIKAKEAQQQFQATRVDGSLVKEFDKQNNALDSSIVKLQDFRKQFGLLTADGRPIVTLSVETIQKLETALIGMGRSSAEAKQFMEQFANVSPVRAQSVDLVGAQVQELVKLSVQVESTRNALEQLRRTPDVTAPALQAAEENAIQATEALKDFQKQFRLIGDQGQPGLELGAKTLVAFAIALKDAGKQAEVVERILAQFVFPSGEASTKQLTDFRAAIQATGRDANAAQKAFEALQATSILAPESVTLTQEQIKELARLQIAALDAAGALERLSAVRVVTQVSSDVEEQLRRAQTVALSTEDQLFSLKQVFGLVDADGVPAVQLSIKTLLQFSDVLQTTGTEVQDVERILAAFAFPSARASTEDLALLRRVLTATGEDAVAARTELENLHRTAPVSRRSLTLTESQISQLVAYEQQAIRARKAVGEIGQAQVPTVSAQQLQTAQAEVTKTAEALKALEEQFGLVGRDGVPAVQLSVQSLKDFQNELLINKVSIEATEQALAKLAFASTFDTSDLERLRLVLNTVSLDAATAQKLFDALRTTSPLARSSIDLTKEQTTEFGRLLAVAGNAIEVLKTASETGVDVGPAIATVRRALAELEDLERRIGLVGEKGAPKVSLSEEAFNQVRASAGALGDTLTEVDALLARFGERSTLAESVTLTDGQIAQVVGLSTAVLDAQDAIRDLSAQGVTEQNSQAFKELTDQTNKWRVEVNRALADMGLIGPDGQRSGKLAEDSIRALTVRFVEMGRSVEEARQEVQALFGEVPDQGVSLDPSVQKQLNAQREAAALIDLEARGVSKVTIERQKLLITIKQLVRENAVLADDEKQLGKDGAERVRVLREQLVLTALQRGDWEEIVRLLNLTKPDEQKRVLTDLEKQQEEVEKAQVARTEQFVSSSKGAFTGLIVEGFEGSENAVEQFGQSIRRAIFTAFAETLTESLFENFLGGLFQNIGGILTGAQIQSGLITGGATASAAIQSAAITGGQAAASAQATAITAAGGEAAAAMGSSITAAGSAVAAQQAGAQATGGVTAAATGATGPSVSGFAAFLGNPIVAASIVALAVGASIIAQSKSKRDALQAQGITARGDVSIINTGGSAAGNQIGQDQRIGWDEQRFWRSDMLGSAGFGLNTRAVKTTIEEFRLASKIDVSNKELSMINRNLVAIRNSVDSFVLPTSAFFAEKPGPLLESEFSLSARRGV